MSDKKKKEPIVTPQYTCGKTRECCSQNNQCSQMLLPGGRLVCGIC